MVMDLNQCGISCNCVGTCMFSGSAVQRRDLSQTDRDLYAPSTRQPTKREVYGIPDDEYPGYHEMRNTELNDELNHAEAEIAELKRLLNAANVRIHALETNNNQEVQKWQDIAEMRQWDTEFLHDILEDIARFLGPDAYTDEYGTLYDEPVVDMIPCLVMDLLVKLEEYESQEDTSYDEHMYFCEDDWLLYSDGEVPYHRV